MGCGSDTWVPHVGDPGLLGWSIVAAYGATAALCAWATWQTRYRMERIVCGSFALVLSVLMVNKQLDLQTGLTVLAKCLAKTQGWYAQRDIVRVIFVVVIVLVVALLLLAGLRAVRGHMNRLWPGCIGAVMLSCFIVLRAAETHAFTADVNTVLFASGLHIVLELGGIAFVALQAVRSLGATA